MRVAILGAGGVGRTLGSAFARTGHTVVLGSRSAENPVAQEWVSETGGDAAATDFVRAVTDAEVVVNATPGLASVDALTPLAGRLVGAVLIDVSNPLDTSQGFPPSVVTFSGESLAERIQQALPQTSVVKALNTVTAGVMVDPAQLGDQHSLFLCGNDPDAKQTVTGLLGEFGWGPDQFVDLGDITAARGMEAYLSLWLRLMGTLGSARFNVAVVS